MSETADAPSTHTEGQGPPSAPPETVEGHECNCGDEIGVHDYDCVARDRDRDMTPPVQPVPLTREELARMRAAAEAEQQDGGHVCLTPALCLVLLDRLGALEAALDDILPFAEGVERQTRSEYGAIISWETELQAILRRARAALGREEASRA